jgi:hypothetical protein
MRTKPVLLLSATLLIAQAGIASAAPDLLPPPSPAQPPDVDAPGDTVWYGYKLMLADAASVALVMAGASTNSDALAMTGLGGTFLGAPLVHAVEGRGGRAVGSLGLRLLMPIAGAALAGWAYDRDHRDDRECDCMGGAFAMMGGMVLGMGTAMLVDALVLGWRTEAPVSKHKTVALIPSIAVTPGGGSLGLAGRF